MPMKKNPVFSQTETIQNGLEINHSRLNETCDNEVKTNKTTLY